MSFTKYSASAFYRTILTIACLNSTDNSGQCSITNFKSASISESKNKLGARFLIWGKLGKLEN
jgi:hypothetical protein